MHGFFEIVCAIKRRNIETIREPIGDIVNTWSKIKIEQVPIDRSFLDEYQDYGDQLPYLRAGDFIFLVMAKQMDLPLITLDKQLASKSKQCGVVVFTPERFLQWLDGV